MFNVLPEILKEEIKKEYHLRWWLIVLFSILFIQISFYIFLLPTWLVSHYVERDIVEQIKAQNSSEVSKNTNLLIKSTHEINDKLTIINSLFEYPKVQNIFNKIIFFKTKDISINQITFETTGTSSATLVVNGVSSTREALVLFVKNLQKTDMFKEVTSPVSNLTKDKNIEFVVGLKSVQ